MPDWKILVADGLDESGLSLLRESAQVDDRTGISPQELLAEIAGCEALIVRSRTRVNEAVFQAGQALKVVGRAGVGVDNIDLAAAARNGVAVVNTPQATSRAVAEHTVALILALARSIPAADASMKSGKWRKKELTGVEVVRGVRVDRCREHRRAGSAIGGRAGDASAWLRSISGR
jgi:D-3-phosphoglycerate dehydrogenase